MEGFLGEYVPSTIRHCANSTAAAAAFPTATRTGARPLPSQPDFLYVPKPGRQTRHYDRTTHAHTRTRPDTRVDEDEDDDDDDTAINRYRCPKVRVFEVIDALLHCSAERYVRRASGRGAKKISPPPPPPRPPALGGAVYAMLRVKLSRKLLCRVMILL